MNLAFACSLRVGEILGLTWDNVHVEEADAAKVMELLNKTPELAAQMLQFLSEAATKTASAYRGN